MPINECFCKCVVVIVAAAAVMIFTIFDKRKEFFFIQPSSCQMPAKSIGNNDN